MTSNRIFYIKEHLLADTSIIFAWMYSISFIFIYIYIFMYGGHLSIGFSLFAWPDGISLKACDYRMG